ncbi:MAG: redoxin domain-containing protein [Candidatus Bipolaricaulis sp.]
MRVVLAALVLWSACGLALGEEVRLAPAPEGIAGDWAQPLVPLRLRATPAQAVRFDGPPLALSQWGEVTLGTAHYPFLLGVRADGQADLWVDRNRDQVISGDELIAGARAPEYVEWGLELQATPAGGEPFPYPLTVLWPAGRGYVYLLGGAPRHGELGVDGARVAFVLVDGDLDGTYGTKGDFYAVDVDRDGIIHGDPDGHERFALTEAFTVGKESYRLSQIHPGGASVTLTPTGYVPPKPPLIPGFPAPEVRFTAFPDGDPVALSDLRGNIVLVDFWATWCGPCMAELPHLRELYAAYHDAGFEIIGLSLDTSEQELRTVLDSERIPWPVAFEGRSWDNSLAQIYRVYQIPTSYLLDRDGIIRYRDLHGEELAEKLTELLAAATPEPEMAPAPVAFGPPVPILEIVVPPEVSLAAGEPQVLAVKLVNTAPYDAEEVKISVQGLPTQVELEVGTIPAFGERVAELAVAPLAESQSGSVAVVYHYCIGDSCFQIEDAVGVAFALGEPAPQPSGIPGGWILIALGVGLVLAVVLRGRGLFVVALVLVGVAGASLAVGILRGQATQAERIGSVLCTACVGIEEVRTEAPTLSPAEREAFAAFRGSAHLVVFHTPWCRSCPYAQALVAEVARANPRISYELVDADQDRARAEAAGVAAAGKVVVPAILVAETGRILFGTSDLSARILAALGEIR